MDQVKAFDIPKVSSSVPVMGPRRLKTAGTDQRLTFELKRLGYKKGTEELASDDHCFFKQMQWN